MSRVTLLGGAYTTRSIIASANEAINLYPEANPPAGSPTVPSTYYPTPGLDLLSAPPTIEALRTLYPASNGMLYGVIGTNVYKISEVFTWTLLGTIADNTTPVSMADNGSVIVLVDGTVNGYAIDMTTDTFGAITDPDFYGATTVCYLDTYFVFNRPGTTQFYISLSNVTYEMLTGTVGAIYEGSVLSGGTLYTAGTYSNVPLTGGSGSGAQATVVVAGGAVTSVTITAGGSGYEIGDALSALAANIGGTGSGFSYSVDGIRGDAFDPLDIASKTGGADNIVGVFTVHGELWLVGRLTTEVWYNSGAADFPFQRIQGAFINHGCAAVYSVAQIDNSLVWFMQDYQGNCIVVMNEGYAVKRISPHGLEEEWQEYGTIANAIAYVHQIEGHAFYVLTFPSEDRTYAMDIATGLWHRRASIDGNGIKHRHRGNCYAFAYGYNLVGDYQNGNLYNLTNTVFTDNGTAIPRSVTFPHLVNDGKRQIYRSLQCDMATGLIEDGETADPPQIGLSWSDDKGYSYGNTVMQSMGATGQYIASVQWNRLGLARDRVFKLEWSANTNTALNGAWINAEACAT